MGEYVIQPGDTLSKIAKMTGTSVEQLQKLNGIKNANLIFAGKTIQIPDIESDQAFKLKGLSVEPEIPKGEIRTVYAYIQPKDDGGKGKWTSPWLPGDDAGVKPLYAYYPPKDKKPGDDDGVPPLSKRPPKEIDDDTPEWRLVYAYIPPKDKKPGDDDGIPPLLKRPPEQDPTADVDPPEIRPVYAYVPPKKDDEIDIPPYIKRPEEEVDPPKDKVKDPKITATAKDNELLESRGASKTANNPNGRAQFVVGDETGEVSVTGPKERPDSITIKDDTNGHTNTYTYRLITDKEIADGKTYDGIPLSKNQFEGNGPFYVLIKVENESGENLKGSHTEVYRLDYSETDDGSRSYDLVQDEGMDGSGRSSMDYRRR